MKTSLRVILPLVVLVAGLGCAATQVQKVWFDETYHGGRPKNVLVIGVVSQPTVRKVIESEFAKRFTQQGITAVESFRVLPTDSLDGDAARTAVIDAVKERGIEAVLMVRTAGSRIEEEYIPGMTITAGHGMPYGSAGAWGGYTAVIASSQPSAPTTQGYSHEQKFLFFETQLYDVRTEKLVWSALSETRLSGPPQEEIKPFVSRISGELFRMMPLR